MDQALSSRSPEESGLLAFVRATPPFDRLPGEALQAAFIFALGSGYG